MKKLVFIFVMLVAMAACGGNSTNSAVAGDSVSVDSIEVVDSFSVDSVDSTAIDTVCVD